MSSKLTSFQVREWLRMQSSCYNSVPTSKENMMQVSLSGADVTAYIEELEDGLITLAFALAKVGK